jgi:murein DD-endopeptidase MepM/ murein hydrolase activator NlpD
MAPFKRYLATLMLLAATTTTARVIEANAANAAVSFGTYVWPVVGPVTRPFEPPQDPYGPGHRGIDIAAPFGSPLHASGAGVVAFSGWVGGSLFISIDHPDGVRTTYSWLSSSLVTKGQSVARDEVIGATGHGHPAEPQTHVHFGARIGSTYIDPMTLLEPGDVSGLIRLAPLDGSGPSRPRDPGWPLGLPLGGRPWWVGALE